MMCKKSFSVPVTHPSLEGHFPKNPIVPGVIILDEILHVIRDLPHTFGTWSGASCVKFHLPLRPEELVIVSLEFSGSGEVAFCGEAEGRAIVSGIFTFRPAPQGPLNRPA